MGLRFLSLKLSFPGLDINVILASKMIWVAFPFLNSLKQYKIRITSFIKLLGLNVFFRRGGNGYKILIINDQLVVYRFLFFLKLVLTIDIFLEDYLFI